MYDFNQLFFGGDGVKEGWDAFNKGDYQTAYNKFKPLAENGDADIQFTLGWIYQNGKGVVQNFKEAAKWFTLAAEKGHPNAQFTLAIMYREGQGVSQDYKEALKWYTCCRAR